MKKKKPQPEVVHETITDPQAIAAAMEDTVDVVPADGETVVRGELPADFGASDPPAWLSEESLVAGKAPSVHLLDAMVHFGLEPADVIAWAGGPEEGLRVVTAGGQKLHWPEDMDRTLTDTEKGRTTPKPTGQPGGEGRFTREGGGVTRG